MEESMSDPLISIITPCYNVAGFIRGAAACIQAQTYVQLEWILIDDGSTDETASVIQSLQDPRIRYFYQENKGQSAALNHGIRVSMGKYIKFFDADDILNDSHIASQLEAIRDEEGAVASCGWARFYDGNLQHAMFRPEEVWRDMPALEWVKTSLSQKYDMMSGWLWLIPRGLLDRIGGWDERLSLNNDFEFTIRLLTHASQVRFAKDARLYYRSGMPSSYSQKSSVKAYEAALLSNDLGCQHLLAREDNARTRTLCADRYQEWLFIMYPTAPELEARLEDRIRHYGGSDRTMAGGSVFRFFCWLLGWRRTKRLKMSLERMGYRKLPF